MCWGLFLITFQAFRPAVLLKRDLQHTCFLVKIAKLSTATFFEEYPRTAASVVSLSRPSFFLKWLKIRGAKLVLVACVYPTVITFFIIIKSDIIFCISFAR